MKKLSMLLLVGLGTVAHAQVLDTCEVWFNDTIAYIDAKTSAYEGIGINQINAGGSYGYAGYAQKFEAPDTVNLLGMCFYGVMDSGADGTAEVKMYDVVGGMPGAVIATTTQVIPFFGSGYSGAMNDASILQCAMFSAPVQWEGDYILSVENHTTTDMYLARSATGDGAMEDIAYTYYEGVSDPSFDGWYRMFNDFGAAWDFDLIFRPIVSYPSQRVLNYDTTVCLGDTLFVEYDFWLDDSLMFNKFYNPNHASYNGYTASHSFDYGDLSPATGDTFHVYTGGGNKGITHTVTSTVATWGTTTFESECMVETEVVEAYYDVPDQSSCSGDSVYFVADMGYDSYLWSDMSTNDSLLVETMGMANGDYAYYLDMELKGCLASDTMTLTIGDLELDLGSDTTLCLNQNIVLTPGAFDAYDWNTGQTTASIQMGPFTAAGQQEIIVEVMQSNCVGSDTLLLTIDNCLGVESVESEEINLYPNPSNGYFHIESTTPIKSVNVVAMTGQIVKAITVPDQNILDITDVSDGVYLLEMETEVGVEYKKVRVIRWNSW